MTEPNSDTPTQVEPAPTNTDEPEPLQPGTDNPPEEVKEEVPADDAAQTGDDKPGDEGGEESEDLSDEDLDAIAELYGERLLKSKTLDSRLSKLVGKEVERQVSERARAQETTAQVDTLVARGKTAAQSLYSVVDAAQKELAKAQKGEDFSADVLSPDKFVADMRDFGSAVAADVARTFDQAVEDAWDEVFSEVLPAVAEEQVGDAVALVETYQRMRADPRQAPQAEAYFFKGLLKFVAERGREFGEKDAIERMGKAKPLLEKISSRNAVAAAKAKIEGQKNPPATPKSKPTDIGAAISDEAYDKAKAEGNNALAQQIVDEMARRRARGQ